MQAETPGLLPDKRHERRPTSGDVPIQPAFIVLYIRFVVCAIAHEVKDCTESAYVFAECALSCRTDAGDAIRG